MTDLRIMCCDICGGDGGFDEECLSVGGYVRVEHFQCSACSGKGEIEVEMQPLTEWDVEELAHAAG